MTKFKMVRHEKSVVGKFVWLFLLSLMGVSASAGSTFKTNTVEGLVYLLTTYNGKDASNVIELAPGDYNLGETKMQDGHSTLGASQLTMNSIRIKGLGATCEATRLIGSGICRVLYMGVSTVLENLTVTNGNAKTIAGFSSSDRGGAVYGESSAVLTNCLFIGNTSKGFGGATAGAPKVYNCRFINNSSVNGGAAWGGSYYNSLFTGNSASSTGGASYNVTLFDGCVISNNTASSSAGGCWMGTYRRCLISGNVASSHGGVGNAKVYDSRLEFNRATTEGSAAWNCSVISNCIVYGNYGHLASGNSYAGAIGRCMVYDSEIYGNGCAVDASTGNAMFGGTYQSTNYNCSIHDNWANYGGAVRESLCVNCHLKNNIAGMGANGMRSGLIGCTIEGTGVTHGFALDSVFTGIGGTVTTTENPIERRSMEVSSVYSTVNATNCLFYGNVLPKLNSILFSASSTAANSLVNCTVVSNTIQHMFHNAKTEAGRLLVQNCLLYGNLRWITGNTSNNDIFGADCAAAGLTIDHTAYGKSGYSTEYATYSNVYKFGDADSYCTKTVGAKPYFCLDKDPEHPYSLRHSSKVRGLGVYQAWMAGANDIRGEDFPRADGTSVDLGCYQCWRPADGMMLLFR